MTDNPLIDELRLNLETLRNHIATMSDEQDMLRNALAPFAREPLTSEPAYNRTRLWSFEDYDAKILAARAAMKATDDPLAALTQINEELGLDT